ncbi:MAG: hypothetical protein ACIAS6_09605 [Phycisphaerales bacterium JB060]
MPSPKRYPTVLLRHDLPDGSGHFDWMLAVDDHGPLVTFRLERDISEDLGAFDGQRIADHRRRYLAYEGPITGNRGVVSRVAAGDAIVSYQSEEAIELKLNLGTRHQHLSGIRQASCWYSFGIL